MAPYICGAFQSSASFEGGATDSFSRVGDRYPCITTDDTSTRRDKRCKYDEGYVYKIDIAYWHTVQRESYPQQYRIFISQRFIYSDAQGESTSLQTIYHFISQFQAFTPVAILIISWVSRIAEPNRKLAMIVCMISLGVALASRGELHFNIIGFVTQAMAVAVRPAFSSP
jgi:hypothetical protein